MYKHDFYYIKKTKKQKESIIKCNVVMQKSFGKMMWVKYNFVSLGLLEQNT